MSTRIIEEIGKLPCDKEKVYKLKTLRKTIKTQLTNVNKYLMSQDSITTQDVSTRLEFVDELFCKFQNIQDHIDLLVNEESLHDEVQYRDELESNLICTKVKLKQLLVSLQDKVSKEHHSNMNSTSNLNFVPYDEKEQFTNFTRRLDVFMKLKHIEDTTLKTFTFLHALTPTIHQKLYDLCAPEDPTTKSYPDLVAVLKNYLDPQASTLALQHKFVSREQHLGESVSDYATELKRLSVDCKFNCSCGKSVCETLLRLQFIRGITDSEIRTRLLQDHETKSFKSVLETAIAIELSKIESKMISSPHEEHSIKQIESTRKQQHLPKSHFQGNQKSLSNNTVSDFNFLKGKCYRCGNPSHKADICLFKNETCRYCNKIGHIARVCLNKHKKKVYNNVNYATEEIHSSEDELHEINKISDRKKNDKITINVKI